METLEKSSMPVGVDSYLDWVSREGMRVHEGVALNLFQLELDDWPRYGVKGAALHFTGRGDYCSMFLQNIPAGGSTSPEGTSMKPSTSFSRDGAVRNSSFRTAASVSSNGGRAASSRSRSTRSTGTSTVAALSAHCSLRRRPHR